MVFEDISFLNEGKQAEEYKARKAKEKEEAENQYYERQSKRYNAHSFDDNHNEIRGKDLKNAMITFGNSAGDQARHYKFSLKGSDEIASRGEPFVNIKKEDEEKNKNDENRHKDSRDFYDSERDRRSKKYDDSYYKYSKADDEEFDASKKYRSAKNQRPGFFGKMTKSGKERENNYQDAKNRYEEAKKNSREASKEKDKNRKNYYNIDDNKFDADSAINRDMRRHPERWNRDSEGNIHRESCGLFESVSFLND